MTEYRVGALMQADFPTLSARMPIRRAVAVLVDTGAAAAPVLGDEGGLEGILTGKDCFVPALHASYHREWVGQVADHMSREVETVDIDDEVIRTAQLFADRPHRVFPVMRGSSVAGLLHRSDVLALLARFG